MPSDMSFENCKARALFKIRANAEMCIFIEKEFLELVFLFYELFSNGTSIIHLKIIFHLFN